MEPASTINQIKMENDRIITIETITRRDHRFMHWLEQLCVLTHEVMSEPPYCMSAWPVGDPRSDRYSEGSIHGTWCRLQESAERNGGALVIVSSGERLVGYGQCICLDAAMISHFSLDHENLSTTAELGDWMFTFAGLHKDWRGLKIHPTTWRCYKAEDAPPGCISLYHTIMDRRFAHAPTKRFFVRTHPNAEIVRGAARKVGFEQVGEFTTFQGGGNQPKVVYVRTPQ